MRPATRYGNWVVLEGGRSIQISRVRQLLYRLGVLRRIKVAPHTQLTIRQARNIIRYSPKGGKGWRPQRKPQ